MHAYLTYGTQIHVLNHITMIYICFMLCGVLYGYTNIYMHTYEGYRINTLTAFTMYSHRSELIESDVKQRPMFETSFRMSRLIWRGILCVVTSKHRFEIDERVILWCTVKAVVAVGLETFISWGKAKAGAHFTKNLDHIREISLSP